MPKTYRILAKWNDDYVRTADFSEKKDVKSFIVNNYNRCKEWTFFEDGKTNTKSVEEFNDFIQWVLEESDKDIKFSVE